MKVITAAEADGLVGAPWFEGYTNTVEVFDDPVTLDSFDAEARAEAGRGSEYLVFAAGLDVQGTLDLRRYVQSIIVVLGTLRARRIVLGDAVLVVTERVEVSEWLLGVETEGLFEVGRAQIEESGEDLVARISAPFLALYDRSRGDFWLCERGQAIDVEKLHTSVRDGEQLDADRLRARLEQGLPVLAAHDR